MKNATCTFFGFCLALLTFAQTSGNKKLIELGKGYKDFMFRNEAGKKVTKDIEAGTPENLKTAVDFIVQTITTNNKLLTKEFLSRPDDQVLKQIYIIRAINLNQREENGVDNNKLIDSLTNATIPACELIDNYYGMLFAAVGNKNQPFNYSKTDFKLEDYNLKDDTEKGIFFLICMSNCNSEIWGYMNIVAPPNTKEAYNSIKKYPAFNGRPYYQYTDFYFPDFEMNIEEGKGKESYKAYYLGKYYETLLFHLICLKKEGESEKKRTDLLLGSILKDSKLYKYTPYKETLEKMFEAQN